MKRYKKHYIIIEIMIAVMLCASFGCAAPESAENAESGEIAKESPEGVSRETVLGPVKATVHLSNRAPVLGEQIVLTLTVEAEPDVVVSMPDFGDQLGRFGIADYKASESVSPSGKNIYSQTYALDLPMSGTLHAPSFLIEFADNRASGEKKGVVQELLTEEIAFDVKSVFGDGRVPEDLKPAIGVLPELVMPDGKKTPIWFYAFAATGICAIAAAVWMLRRKKTAPELPPDEVALSALAALAERGMPDDPSAADRWYVELSSILRTYIERRFGLGAPRLTTEEFFDRAKRSELLGDEEKQLIRALLERSDRVKFTDFMPSREETERMLSDARRFIGETREKAPQETKNA